MTAHYLAYKLSHRVGLKTAITAPRRRPLSGRTKMSRDYRSIDYDRYSSRRPGIAYTLAATTRLILKFSVFRLRPRVDFERGYIVAHVTFSCDARVLAVCIVYKRVDSNDVIVFQFRRTRVVLVPYKL